MDPFAAIVLGGVGGLLLALVLLSRPVPGRRGAAPEPPVARSTDADDDVAQLLEAANRHRRRRGEPELTEEGVRAGLDADGPGRRRP